MQTEIDIDRALVRRVQAGERAAFDRLVERYERRLMRVVSRLVRNPVEAEDVVQDSFIRAFRGLHLFRGDSAFYTWLYRIAMNCAKNHLQSRSREPSAIVIAADQDEAEPPQECERCTPETMLAEKQLIGLLNQTLDFMPVVLSTALVLGEIEGMSYDQIAQVMACPIGTVRSRIFRARELLSQKLAPARPNAQGQMKERPSSVN